jgi:hypothetical protein
MRAICSSGLLVAVLCRLAPGGAAPDVHALYEARHWFALRDTVQPLDPPIFYRKAVDAAFNQREAAEKELAAIMRAERRRRLPEDRPISRTLAQTNFMLEENQLRKTPATCSRC